MYDHFQTKHDQKAIIYMNRQESAALNMAKFIRAQTLLLLEKLDTLDLDEESADCETLHEQADTLYRKLSEKLEQKKE